MDARGGVGCAARALGALAMAVVCAAGVAGCSKVPFVSRDKDPDALWTSGNQYVRLEPQDRLEGAPTPPNQHPAQIPSARIRAALQSLAAQRPKGSPMRLFTKDSLDALSRHLAAGLARARPDQDVTFAVEQWYPWGVFGTDIPQAITGRVFYSGNWVHLVFGSILREGTMDKAPGYNDLRRNAYAPGRRSAGLGQDWVLSAPPHAGFFRAPGTARTDWLVFAPYAPAAPPPAPAPAPAPGAAPGVPRWY